MVKSDKMEFGSRWGVTLHVPDFKCNLLSVKALVITAKISCTFYPTHCILQDLQTDKIVASGKIVGNLYVLDNSTLVNYFPD